MNNSIHPNPNTAAFEPPITGASQPGDARYLLPDPLQPNTYWTASWGGGVWKSSDGGRTWVPKNNGLLNLMIDSLHIDSSIPPASDGYGKPYMYAAQSPLAGLGTGFVYRSRDGGESWEAAGVCKNPFGPVSYFQTLDSGPKLAINPGDGPRTAWATQSFALEDCGMLFRSTGGGLLGPGCDRPGDCWCSFSPACQTDIQNIPVCSNGPGEISGNTNDGSNVVSIYQTGEVYFLHPKLKDNIPCRNSFRDTLASQTSPVSWKLFDRWTGPTVQTGSCLGRAIDRLRTADIAYDPSAPQWRFGEYFEVHECDPFNPVVSCADPLCAPICGFTAADCSPFPSPCVKYQTPLWADHLAYSSGQMLGSDLQWNSIVDLKTYFGQDHFKAHTGIYPIVFRSTQSGAGTVKEIFARYRDRDGARLFYCDASASDADCTVVSAPPPDPSPGWKCLLNNANRVAGCNTCSPPFYCDPGTSLLGDNVLLMKMTASNWLVNGHHEALLEGRRLHARNELLRVYHDGTTWQREYLMDPATCTPSGPELLSPHQVIQFPGNAPIADRLLMASPRQVFKSDDGGSTWSAHPPAPPSQPSGLFEGGPILQVAPSDPSVVYALYWDGIKRSPDQGATWNLIEAKDRGGRGSNFCNGVCDYLTTCDACPPECRETCGTTAQCTAAELALCDPAMRVGAGCTRPGRCGRLNDICGSANWFVVDRTDANLLFAATESGAWRFKYPFDGSGACKQQVDPQCLSEVGAAFAGERGWSEMQDAAQCSACLTAGGACVKDRYLQAIAQDPGNSLHFVAGGGKFAPDPASGLTVVQDGGLYQTTDGGACWFPVALVPPDEMIFRIHFVPTSGPLPKILVAARGGVYWSDDNGATWSVSTQIGIPIRDLSSPEGGNGQTVYAAAMDWSPDNTLEGVYRSADGGTTWNKLVATQENEKTMAVFASRAGRVFAGVVGGGLLEVDPLSPAPQCPRVSPVTYAGTPGNILAGSAVTAVGDFLDTIVESNCTSEWAELEFNQGATLHAKVMVWDSAGNIRGVSPLDPGVNLAQARGSIVSVADPAGGACPDIAIGLPRPLPPATGSVTIMNICTGATWNVLSPPAVDFGTSLARTANYLAVGAPAMTDPKVYIYRLDPTGPVLVQTLNGASGTSFGWSLAFADLNADGATDLAVGAPALSTSNSFSGVGSVSIYSGATGWSPPALATLTPPGAPLQAAFGFSLSSGYDRRSIAPIGSMDLVVGAPGANGKGAAYWYGSAADAVPDVVNGENASDAFGWSVLLARDITGDSLADLVVGAPFNEGNPPGIGRGAVYLYDGTTLHCAPKLSVPNPAVDGAEFGKSLSEAGDVNKDRTIDFLVGRPETAAGTPGRTYQYLVRR